MSGAARWLVQPSDAGRLTDVLARMGEGALGAAAEGRAFVNGRRAAAEDVVAAGDEVVVFGARSEGADEEAWILARWGEIVAAYKPPSMPTTPDRRGDRSLVVEVKRLLGGELRGRDLPHAASRLDVGVSGVVLCALGGRGQAHIEAMRSQGRVRRVYAAIAAGLIEGAGTWDAGIGRARGPSDRWKPAAGGRDVEPASTRFQVIAHARPCSPAGGVAARSTLLVAEPVTGRMHQIRVHAATAGGPLVGDREHGGPRSIVDGAGRVHAVRRIGLHAFAVEIPDARGALLRSVAPVPEDLRGLWRTLDGPDAAWDEMREQALARGDGNEP